MTKKGLDCILNNKRSLSKIHYIWFLEVLRYFGAACGLSMAGTSIYSMIHIMVELQHPNELILKLYAA